MHTCVGQRSRCSKFALSLQFDVGYQNCMQGNFCLIVQEHWLQLINDGHHYKQHRFCVVIQEMVHADISCVYIGLRCIQLCQWLWVSQQPTWYNNFVLQSHSMWCTCLSGIYRNTVTMLRTRGFEYSIPINVLLCQVVYCWLTTPKTVLALHDDVGMSTVCCCAST